MTNMNSQSNDLFGIRRSTILIISIALAIGSFSAWKAVSGGSATAASISVSGTALAAGGDKLSSVVAGLQTEPHSSTVRAPAAHTTASLGSAILTKADADAAHHPGSVMAGLPTEPYAAVRTTLTPIEQIQVGDRVLAESPTGEEDTAFGSEIIPADWRKLTLRAPKRDGTTAEVVLLRPLQWLNEQRSGRSRLPSGTFAGRRTNARHLSNVLGSDFGATNALSGRDASRNPARQAGPTVESQTIEDMVGGTVFISVPECGIDGNAQVLSIDPCPEIPSGAGRVVTGTFLHQARSTITLTIAGQSEPIECTGNHPFWSEDRQTFVRADSLQPNETLRTATGLTTVESWTPDLNPTPVYNIEVHGAHVYHVGTSGVVVHNGTGLPCPDAEQLFNPLLRTEKLIDAGIVERYGDVVEILAKTPNGMAVITSDMTRVGDRLVFDNMSVVGKNLTPGTWIAIARDIMRQEGATEAVIRGTRRTTDRGNFPEMIIRLFD